MKGQKNMTYQEALDQGRVKENDYFLVRYPDGRKVLFRLVNTEKGHVMWSPPTEGEIILEGKDGDDKLFDLADSQAKKEYALDSVFEEVHACSLPEKYYKVCSHEEYSKLVKNVEAIYKHSGDIGMYYFLASCCVDIGSTNVNFYVFTVNSGSVFRYWLYGSDGGSYSPSGAVRPEAIPKSTLRLNMNGCDGSKENPWICISDQEAVQEEVTENPSIADGFMMLAMKGQKSMTYQEGLDQGRVKENDYFLVKYPDGRKVLFRLVKTEEGHVMWGPPTEGKILFRGRGGNDKLFDLADGQAKKEYALDGVFEEVHACSLPKKYYKVYSYAEYHKLVKDVETIYKHADDVGMYYFLASRCVVFDISSTEFGVFVVSGGSVNGDWLYDSRDDTSNWARAVRPEAIPKSTLRLNMNGCDGSKENPWICISDQEVVQEEVTENPSVDNQSLTSISKDGLASLIQEAESWLTRLKKYANDLK